MNFIVNGQQVRATESNGILGFLATTKEQTIQKGRARPVVGFVNGQRIRANDQFFLPVALLQRVNGSLDDVPSNRAAIKEHEDDTEYFVAPSWVQIL